jgi:hypothetical protein
LDRFNAGIANLPVTLVNNKTAECRGTKTLQGGSFLFSDIPEGQYSLKIRNQPELPFAIQSGPAFQIIPVPSSASASPETRWWISRLLGFAQIAAKRQDLKILCAVANAALDWAGVPAARIVDPWVLQLQPR